MCFKKFYGGAYKIKPKWGPILGKRYSRPFGGKLPGGLEPLAGKENRFYSGRGGGELLSSSPLFSNVTEGRQGIRGFLPTYTTASFSEARTKVLRGEG